MTSRRAQEPYTFAAFGEVPEAEPAAIQGALKDSVAAHQAECGCHTITCDAMGEIDCCSRRKSGTPPDARDLRGDQWHIDPLCKVRPEAKGRSPAR